MGRPNPMPEIAVEMLPSHIEQGQSLAALDLGTKTIGIAVSDPGLSLAHPRPVIRRKKFSADVAVLKDALVRDNVAAIVLGLPINMDGTEGSRAQATRAFTRNMAGHIALPYAFWDERLSTVAAERALLDQDMSRKKRAERIDSAAAAFILQGVLDRLYSAGVGS